MKSHIGLTIDEIDEKIIRLTHIRDGLVQVFGKVPNAAPPPPVAKKKRVARIISSSRANAPTLTASSNAVEESPVTFGRAMKLEILAFPKPFSADDLKAAMEKNYPALVAAASASSFSANLSYWVAKQKLEKLGTGSLAMLRILDKEFFSTPAN